MFENLVLLAAVLVFGGIGVYATFNFLLGELRKAVRKNQTSTVRALSAFALVAAVLASKGVSFAQATAVPLDLDIDIGPLFAQIGQYLPLFLGVLAVGGAIGIAVDLAGFVIRSVRGGFKGSGGKG